MVIDNGMLVVGGIVIGLSIVLSVLALIFSISSLIKSIGAEKSTHSVQYIPIDEEVDKENQEYVKEWATSDKAIKQEKKFYQEELEDEMPFFASTKEDKEIFSL